MKKSQNNIEYLTFAFLSDGLTAGERDDLQQLLKDSANKAYFRKMYAIWYAAGRAVREEDVEQAMQKAMFRIKDRRSIQPSVWSFSFKRMAAAVFISFISGAGLYYAVNTNKESKGSAGEVIAVLNEVTVPMGSKSSVKLPDGTVVTLNAGSRLQYDATFGSHSREVILEGEGYFQVTKNAAVPFVVRAKDITVKALGTEFNVKAYPEERTVQTTLVNGSVSVKQSNADIDAEEIVLEPKQMVTMASTAESDETNAVRQSANNMRQTSVVLKENVNTELYTSWKDHRWVIESESLENLAKMLQRRYDVKIIIADESLKRYPFSGILADETLEQVLEIMKTVVPIDYSIHQKTVRWVINPHQRKIFERSMK